MAVTTYDLSDPDKWGEYNYFGYAGGVMVLDTHQADMNLRANWDYADLFDFGVNKEDALWMFIKDDPSLATDVGVIKFIFNPRYISNPEIDRRIYFTLTRGNTSNYTEYEDVFGAWNREIAPDVGSSSEAYSMSFAYYGSILHTVIWEAIGYDVPPHSTMTVTMEFHTAAPEQRWTRYVGSYEPYNPSGG